jgi:hypothetical protein
MGEFYDAIYTRGADAATLHQQLADAARELNCCFLVAPEMQGWTAIYSSDGQDNKVAEALHKLLKTEVLYTLVHDGDIFCYYYYRDGKLVDEYNSRPDYFEKVSAAKRQSQAGKPELLLPLLREPSDLGKLKSILHSEPGGDRLDANLQLTQLGELLGVPNCATSYDYLIGDEEDEAIERRAEFVHIPDLEPEKAARASARGALRVETDRMQAEGWLLFEQSPSPFSPAADPAGSGFITADRDMSFRATERPIYRIAPPFEEGPKPLGIMAKLGHGLLLSPSGRLLAMIDREQIEVWDRQTRARVAAMEVEPPVNAVRFLAEDKGLVVGGKRLVVFSLPEGRRARTIEVSVYRAMALHPAGSLLVVASTRVTVHVVDLDAGQIVRTFFLDGRQDLGFIEKMQLATVTAARKAHNEALARTENVSPEYEAALAAQAREPLTAEDPHVFLFSADGRYLVCGTNKAAWVFRWRTLLALGVETPPAVYRYRMESKPTGMPLGFLMPTIGGGVGSLVYDAETNCALLGCADGVVRRMDLASGEVSTLLTVPGANYIRSMALSADGSLLSTEDVAMHNLQNMVAARTGWDRLAAALKLAVGFKDDDPRGRMMIWDYRKLRGHLRS